LVDQVEHFVLSLRSSESGHRGLLDTIGDELQQDLKDPVGDEHVVVEELHEVPKLLLELIPMEVQMNIRRKETFQLLLTGRPSKVRKQSEQHGED
jgi:hypothetical protein